MAEPTYPNISAMSWLDLLRQYFPDLSPYWLAKGDRTPKMQQETGEGSRSESSEKGTQKSGPLSADEKSTLDSTLGFSLSNPSLIGLATSVLGSAIPGLNTALTGIKAGLFGTSALADVLGAPRETDPFSGMTAADLQGIADTYGFDAAAQKAADMQASLEGWNAAIQGDEYGPAQVDARTVLGSLGWGPGGWEGTPAGFGSTTLGDARGTMGTNNPSGYDAPSVANPDAMGGSTGPGNSDTSGTADSTGGSRGSEGSDRAKGGVDVIRKPTRLRFGERKGARPETVISIPPSMLRPGIQDRERQVVDTMRNMLAVLGR